MQTSLILTVIGADRPGLVDSVATAVAEHGGNWLESRMLRLGGQFAGIVRVQLPCEREAELRTRLQALAADGLTVAAHSDPAAVPAAGAVSIIEVVGHDRPGIVREIAHALAAHGVNVEELQTECASAAMSGEILFRACARVATPASCDPEELRRGLEKIASDLIVDIHFGEGVLAHRKVAGP